MAAHGERRVRTGPSVPPVPPGGLGAAPRPEHAAHPARHCWVADGLDGRGVRPGLLVEWRRRDGRWEGRVIYVGHLRTGWGLVQEWVPAGLLMPLTVSCDHPGHESNR